MSDFDIVIVGAGPSALGLVYGILTKPSLRLLTIAVIELGERSELSNKGKNHNHIGYWFRKSHGSPLRLRNRIVGAATQMPRTRMLYPTTPQAKLNNRILDVPIGVGVGGGSNVNAGFCTPPDFKNDFTSWPGVWKNGDLIKNSIEEILAAMNDGGGLTLWRVCPTFAEMFNLAEDNNINQENCYIQPGSKICFLPYFSMATNWKGQRVSYYDSLLHPLIDKDMSAKERVKFFTGVAVTRIIIESKVARGVECVNMKLSNSKPFIIKATREVIICAGAIMSPTLLILSGVGDRRQIDLAGVSRCHAHIPAVGRNLRDHILLPRAFISPNQRRIKPSMNSVQAKYMMSLPVGPSIPDQEAKARYQFEVLLADGSITWMIIPHMIASIFRRGASMRRLNRKDSCSIQNVIAVACEVSFNITCSTAFTVIRLVLFLLAWFYPVRLLIQNFTAVTNVCLLNPESKGCITVIRKKTGERKAAFDGVEILVNPGYMTDERDLQALRVGWKASDAIVEHHYKSCIEVLPGILRFLLHDWLDVYAAEFLLPYYHWIGTCAMGSTTEAYGDDQQQAFVVNDKLQVIDIQKLRVCDASVFPTCISAPTALTCAGIGLSLSAFLS